RFEALGGRRSAGLPFAGSLLRGGAELALPLGRFDLSVFGWWQRDDFDHTASDLFFRPYDPFDPKFDPPRPHGTRRRDVTWRAVAALSWEMRDHLQVVGRLGWIDRTSNIGLTGTEGLDYRRTVTSLGLSWAF